MRLIPLETDHDVSVWAARYIVDRINAFQPTKEKPLCLAYQPAVRLKNL